MYRRWWRRCRGVPPRPERHSSGHGTRSIPSATRSAGTPAERDMLRTLFSNHHQHYDRQILAQQFKVFRTVYPTF